MRKIAYVPGLLFVSENKIKLDKLKLIIRFVSNKIKSLFLFRLKAVLQGFGDVGGGNFFGTFEIGDGAGDFDDAIIGAGAQVKIRNRFFHKFQ